MGIEKKSSDLSSKEPRQSKVEEKEGTGIPAEDVEKT